MIYSVQDESGEVVLHNVPDELGLDSREAMEWLGVLGGPFRVRARPSPDPRDELILLQDWPEWMRQ